MNSRKEIHDYGDHCYVIWLNEEHDYHRDDGPSWILYRKNGTMYAEKYYNNGKLDRRDGPAEIFYSEDGSIDYESFYILDKCFLNDFWEYFDNLNEKEKNNHNILKTMLKYI